MVAAFRDGEVVELDLVQIFWSEVGDEADDAEEAREQEEAAEYEAEVERGPAVQNCGA